MHEDVRDHVWQNGSCHRHEILYVMFDVESRGKGDARFYWELNEPTDDVVFWRSIMRAGDVRAEVLRINIKTGEIRYPNRVEE